ncbi:MAG: M67 family metallopeptidase [Deltaproteobacteria bacterium]|nr:M67 family metallopeptidase [Deltaproteobacteria bacterium]
MPRLSEYVIQQICLHAEREYPSEACGMIIGPQGKENAIGVFPIRNIQDELHQKDPKTYTRDSRTAYFMDPKQMKIVEKEAAHKGFDLKVIYHSHPDHEVYFSDEDRLMAAPWGEPNLPGVVWVVISVKNGKAVAASEFEWSDEKKDYVESKLKV